MKTVRLSDLLTVFLALAVECLAQTSTTQISGTVRDSSGAVVAGTNVTLVNEDTGVSQKQASTDAGVYALPAIPAGAYTVKVEAAGFKTFTRARNIVEVNTPITVDVNLEVGAATETVSVVASAETIQNRWRAWCRTASGISRRFACRRR